MTGCWQCIKEVSLIIGTFARYAPFPPASAPPQGPAAHPALFSVETITTLGDKLLHLLFHMKHVGAVEKTAAGLMALSERLLQSPNPHLAKLPGKWLDDILRHISREGQSRSDIVRRSSGVPFALVSLFLAEPASAPKVLFPRGINSLLIIGGEGLEGPKIAMDGSNGLFGE